MTTLKGSFSLKSKTLKRREKPYVGCFYGILMSRLEVSDGYRTNPLNVQNLSETWNKKYSSENI